MIFEKLELFHSVNSPYRDPEMLIQILNNVACCHRRINSLEYSIEVLKRALSIAKAHNLNSGVTYTNLSAVYSQKKMTQKALKISQQAISELYPLMLSNKTHENIKLLAIAYYNLANQESQVKDYQGSMINYKRGINLLKGENYSEDDPVLVKLQSGYKQVRAKFNKQKIFEGSSKRRRPSSAGIKPNSSRVSKNHPSSSKISFSKKNNNFSSFSRPYSKKRQRRASFKPITSKKNPSLTMFNNMQWRKSNEYTHNDDKYKIDRVHLHSNIKPRKLNAYKSENPRFEKGLNSSRLTNKTKNRRLFDGSKSTLKSKNASRISAQKKGYKTYEDDFLY